MTTKIKISIAFILAVLLILQIYAIVRQNYVSEKKEKLENEIKSFDLFKKEKQLLIGKTIKNPVELIKKISEEKKNVVFVFSASDCSSCIDKGFELIKKIEKDSLINVLAITSFFNIENVEKKYVMQILNDEKNLIFKELKYVQTPILLFLDKESKITDLFKVTKDNYYLVEKEAMKLINGINDTN